VGEMGAPSRFRFLSRLETAAAVRATELAILTGDLRRRKEEAPCEGDGNPIFKRWYALMWKYGYAEGKRRPL
jgi:hypothetical protein